MRIRFLWIGKTRDPWLTKLEDKYLERLERFFVTERVTLPELKKTDVRQRPSQFSREGSLIEKKLSPGGWLVVVDEAGEQRSSQELAGYLEGALNSGVPELTFLVGGYLGVPDKTKDSAHLRLSLGRLTLPHELARVVLVEQVYRAVTILKGLPYHR